MADKLRNPRYIIPVLLVVLLIFFVRTQKHVASCTITPAVLNTSSVDSSTVNLTWSNGQNSKITYLNVSTSKSLMPDGTFSEAADVVNDIVTDKNSYSKSDLSPGTYYWNIISDGCGQRKASSLNSFTISPPTADADCQLTPAVLDTPVVDGSKVILSWTNDQNVKAAYINISTSKTLNSDGVLQNVNIANDVVSGKTSFTRENLFPGTYFWNIAGDGCGQRKISNLGSFAVQ